MRTAIETKKEFLELERASWRQSLLEAWIVFNFLSHNRVGGVEELRVQELRKGAKEEEEEEERVWYTAT
jgi:hypothetical protein